jgi:hypothetical protein
MFLPTIPMFPWFSPQDISARYSSFYREEAQYGSSYLPGWLVRKQPELGLVKWNKRIRFFSPMLAGISLVTFPLDPAPDLVEPVLQDILETNRKHLPQFWF